MIDLLLIFIISFLVSFLVICILRRYDKRLEFLENFFEQLSDSVDVDAFKAYCDEKYKGGEDK